MSEWEPIPDDAPEGFTFTIDFMHSTVIVPRPKGWALFWIRVREPWWWLQDRWYRGRYHDEETK